MNLIPKHRAKIMKYFKKTLGYGYRCVPCDRNARITQAFVNFGSDDSVQFICPGCRKSWQMVFKKCEITELVFAKS